MAVSIYIPLPASWCVSHACSEQVFSKLEAKSGRWRGLTCLSFPGLSCLRITLSRTGFAALPEMLECSRTQATQERWVPPLGRCRDGLSVAAPVGDVWPARGIRPQGHWRASGGVGVTGEGHIRDMQDLKGRSLAEGLIGSSRSSFAAATLPLTGWCKPTVIYLSVCNCVVTFQ